MEQISYFQDDIELLMALAGLILMIATLNIANLTAAQGSSQGRETAVRLGLGASRWRLIRQMLTESVMLSMMGGLLALAVATFGIRVLTVYLANGFTTFAMQPELDYRLMGVAFLVAVAVGILFGIAPAMRAAEPPGVSLRQRYQINRTAQWNFQNHPRQSAVGKVFCRSLTMVTSVLSLHVPCPRRVCFHKQDSEAEGRCEQSDL